MKMLLFLSVITVCLHLYATQVSAECYSPSFNFASYTHPELLDLTTPPGSVIASFPVENVRSATVVQQPSYLEARIVGTDLQFLTTAAFAQYEEREIQTVIILQVSYQCTTSTKNGLYRHNLKLANNHAPSFLQDAYEAVVPLPLPKHFDVTPFITNGAGIMARDIDLINNAVTFSVTENDYMLIESHTVLNDPKQFKAILRLKEQVLKMPNKLELTVTATDAGVPQKSTQVSVVIDPDLSIVYDDPPVFKETFINTTIEKDLLLRVELIPGTETYDVQYSLQGTDAQYFTQTVWENNTGMDLKMIDLGDIPKAKPILNVVAVAKRSQLQATSCVVLVHIPPDSDPEVPATTVDKVLSVLHLNEMSEHQDIFPLAIESCTYSIQSQTPGDYFFIEDATIPSLSSKAFDREDKDLFSGLDFPQFWIVLKLACPVPSTTKTELESHTNWNRSGPMRDIEFSTDLTHLNIIVDDVNDNSPVFSFPPNDAQFAFPTAYLARKMLPDRLLQVEASDLDEGLNAVIRYSLAANDHFDIDPRTGVIFPLKSALDSEESVSLEIIATDRDGAQDGNVSKVKIRVFKATDEQLVVLTVKNIDPNTFESLLNEISLKEGIQMETVRNVFSVDGEELKVKRRSTNEQYSTTAIVYAFKKDRLLPRDDLIGAFKSMDANFTMIFTKLNDLYAVQPKIVESDTTAIYPYIIVAAFFGTLVVAMGAAALYYRNKIRRANNSSTSSLSRSSNISDSIIVQHDHKAPSSTPPVENGSTHPITNARSLSDLLAIVEDTEQENEKTEPKPPTQQDRKKSIKFSDHVERIEVFDKYPTS
ncbi:protocadherin-like wing polarity protein stan isoform X1 [Anopheles gambiae]|uniref:Cadherin domain-containing protein n=1 Tax=Anopheles coluzzii TaxID=1518534 RepID=A0A6E8WAR4_ANOCL|nr:protocadherin-like wing polarity protein stan isoform X1 [Anopheles coluzzii]XP_316183.4 protocadherin-like wing polarity protein stan isoform X1 [Anopheles gambiae]